MKNKRIGCINRDRNSCLNMLKIVDNWFKKKERPEYLKRKIKDSNSDIVKSQERVETYGW